MMKVKLGELIQESGRRNSNNEEITVYSVTKYSGFVPSQEYFNKQVFARDLTNYKIVNEGEFAYATIHLDEGSIGIAPERSLISPMYTVFACDETKVDPKYLLRYLKSPRALAAYQILGNGAVHRRKSITLKSLAGLSVPLPELEEQRRIAAILDKADEIRAKRQQMLDHLDSLKARLINAAVLDAKARRQLSELVDGQDRLNYGVVQPGDSVVDGVPLIRVADINEGYVSHSDLKTISAEVSKKHAKSLLRGTEILLTCVGSIGQVALVSETEVGMQIARAVARIPITDPEMRMYVSLMLQSEDLQRYFRSELRTVAQPTLNIRQISEARIPMVDAERMKSLQSEILQIEKTWRNLQKQLELDVQLANSLQDRAFRGEL